MHYLLLITFRKHNLTNCIVYHHLKCPVKSVNCATVSSGPKMLNGCSSAIHNGTTNGTTSNGMSNGSTNGTTDAQTNGTSNGILNGVQNGCSSNGSKSGSDPTPAIPWDPDMDVWWHEVMDKESDLCEPVWVDAEDPLFILYTR